MASNSDSSTEAELSDYDSDFFEEPGIRSPDDSDMVLVEHYDSEQIEAYSNEQIPDESQGLNALARFIGRVCNENENIGIIFRLTHRLGRERALRYLQWALNLQSTNGGILVRDGTRIRTIGGMWLRLIRDDPAISREERKSWFGKGKHKFWKEGFEAERERLKRTLAWKRRRQTQQLRRRQERLQEERLASVARRQSTHTEHMLAQFRNNLTVTTSTQEPGTTSDTGTQQNETDSDDWDVVVLEEQTEMVHQYTARQNMQFRALNFARRGVYMVRQGAQGTSWQRQTSSRWNQAWGININQPDRSQHQSAEPEQPRTSRRWREEWERARRRDIEDDRDHSQ